MSDNIPFEIQEDIIKRFPAQSLVRFRSVSKAWKSLIDSSDFVAQYSVQHQHLLVRYHHDSDKKYLSIAYDDTFPQHKVYLTVPRLVNGGRIIGCTHGLLCVYGHCHNSDTVMAVVWNLSIRKSVGVVVIDGCLYWLATDKITSDRCDNLIISFDMTSEEFTEVNLPDSLAHQTYLNLSMCKLRESLVVLQRDVIETEIVVWMMEDGVPKSFINLFSVNVNLPLASVLGFTKSGVPIVENCGVLVVYEPYSEHRDNFGIQGRSFTFSAYPYVETLLLHDQTYLRVYNDI
ncbi:hypothetical protein L1987_65274 [Smallanthus sonchifolius]|uniref:Uncharacterized protein n=1 Tax=Smallanthus sonchifolius TaxID=185202 RepID=A0ACB9BU14_9ASTR|nr:hypothetical protein L1987_65274 [Smallanthus sonchifolius]